MLQNDRRNSKMSQTDFCYTGSYPEFVLTGVICIENALKGTEIVLVLTGNSY